MCADFGRKVVQFPTETQIARCEAIYHVRQMYLFCQSVCHSNENDYYGKTQKQKKGGENPYRITPPHAVGDVIRSGVAPLRCSLSYTAAKIGKVLVIAKTF